MTKQTQEIETEPTKYVGVERVDSIEAKVSELEAKLATNESVGKLFAGAIKESHSLRVELGATLVSLLKDHETREELKLIIKSIDREEGWKIVKRYGGYILGLLTATGIIFGILGFFFGKK